MQEVRASSSPGGRRHLLRDYTLYVAISFAFIAAVGWAMFSDVPQNVISVWMGFGLFVVFLFGDLVWESRRVWKDRVFWCGVVLLLVANYFLFRYLLGSGGHVNAFEMITIGGVETAIFKAFRGWREKANREGSQS